MEDSSPGILFGGDAWGGCTWSVFGLSAPWQIVGKQVPMPSSA
jgi:hypothetical protein